MSQITAEQILLNPTDLQVGIGNALERTPLPGPPFTKAHSKAGFSPFSTSSTSYVNVTGAAVTKFNQVAKCGVIVTLPVDNSANSYSFQLLIDGLAAPESDFNDVTQTDNGITSLFYLSDALGTADNHTFQLQVKSVTGGAVNLGAGDIIVFELDTNYTGVRNRFTTLSTGSTSYVDVATITQTTDTPMILVNATFPMNNLTSAFALILRLNGSDIATTEMIDQTSLKNGLVSVTWLLDSVPTGSNIFKLRVKRTAGSDTLVLGDGNFTIIEQSGSLQQAGGQVGGKSTTSTSYVDLNGYGVIHPSGPDLAQVVDTTEAVDAIANTGAFITMADTAVTISKQYAGSKLLYLVSYSDADTDSGNTLINYVTGVENHQVDFRAGTATNPQATQKALLLTSGLAVGNHSIHMDGQNMGGSSKNVSKIRAHLLEMPELDGNGATLGYGSYQGTNTEHSTSSGITYADVPLATITTSCVGGQALVFVSFEKYGVTDEYQARFRITVNGTPESREYISLHNDNDWVEMVYLVNVTAGSNTIKIQARHDNNNSLNPGISDVYMSVLEMPTTVNGETKQYQTVTPTGSLAASSPSYAEIATSGSIAITNTSQFMVWITCDVDGSATAQVDFKLKIDGTDKQTWSTNLAEKVGADGLRRQTMAVVHVTDTNISAGNHTFSVQSQMGSGTATFYNLRLILVEYDSSVIPVTDTGASTSTAVTTTQDKALVSYSAPIKNFNSNYALRLLANGVEIANTEVTDTTGNSDGMVTVSGLTGTLVDGVNTFKAQIKRTSGSDTLEVYTGQFVVTELPDVENSIASNYATDTGNFDGILSGTDTDLQIALDTIDDKAVDNGKFVPQTQTVSGPVTIDFADGFFHKLTTSGSITGSWTLNNPVEGDSYLIEIIYTGSHTVSALPVAVKWTGGVSPSFSATSGRKDLINLFYDGTYYIGSVSLNHF